MISVHIPPLPWEDSPFLRPLVDLCHGWQGRRSSSQGKPSFHYLTPATLMGKFMQPLWHRQREFASFLLCSICKVVWWSAKVPNCISVVLGERSIISFGVSSFSHLNHSHYDYYFTHHNKAVIYVCSYTVYFETLVLRILLQGHVTASILIHYLISMQFLL